MGRVHSIETGSAVDGPGLRTVVFLQGCPLRCKFCHNPDTWDFSGGQERSAEEIAQTALRLKRFYGLKGGVTFSGGEPLAQPELLHDIAKRRSCGSAWRCCIKTAFAARWIRAAAFGTMKRAPRWTNAIWCCLTSSTVILTALKP